MIGNTLMVFLEGADFGQRPLSELTAIGDDEYFAGRFDHGLFQLGFIKGGAPEIEFRRDAARPDKCLVDCDFIYFIPILVGSQAEFVMDVKFRHETGKGEILENLLSERLYLLMDGGDKKDDP